jgi:hypothetical protein
MLNILKTKTIYGLRGFIQDAFMAESRLADMPDSA